MNSKKLINKIIQFINPKQTQGRRSFSNLRDLELYLHTPKDTKTILSSLKDNYMVKTIRLTHASNKWVDKETESIALSIKNNRVGAEVRIISSNTKFKTSKTSSIEVFYPDAL